MRRTETKIASSINLKEPPNRGSLSIVTNLSEEAHYLRVTLDKSENFKVAVGKKLNELLEVHFGGQRNRLRDWYEREVVEGKAHRAWATVEDYLIVVRKHGDRADEVFENLKQRDTEIHRANRQRRLERAAATGSTEHNNNNDLRGDPTTQDRPRRSEYELRSMWLGEMNYQWFKGKPEWQDKWLEDRNLHKGPGWSR